MTIPQAALVDFLGLLGASPSHDDVINDLEIDLTEDLSIAISSSEKSIVLSAFLYPFTDNLAETQKLVELYSDSNGSFRLQLGIKHNHLILFSALPSASAEVSQIYERFDQIAQVAQAIIGQETASLQY